MHDTTLNPQPENTISPLLEQAKEDSFLRIESILKHARQLRALDRERVMRELGLDSRKLEEPKSDAVEKPAEAGQETLSEEEKERREFALKEVHTLTRASGQYHYFKQAGDVLAFKDKGRLLSTHLNDEKAVQAMCLMAQAKGWSRIQVSGHKDFCRQVWLEASLKGLEVKGYRPDEKDIQLLEARLEDKAVNQVKAVDNPEAKKQDVTQPQAFEINEWKGTLISHGSAPFRHDPANKGSYFVTLQLEKGEKTFWGMDLKRAMQEAHVKKGDEIKVSHRGKTPVMVKVPNKNLEGKVLGEQTLTIPRNVWEVQKTEKMQVFEKAAEQLVQTRVKNPQMAKAVMEGVRAELLGRGSDEKVPPVFMYDKQAPSLQKAQEATPIQEKIPMQKTR